LRNDKQSLQRENSTVQQAKDSKINSLQSEKQELKLKNISLHAENQSLKHKIDEYEQQINAKVDEINLLKEEHRSCHTSSTQQTQALNSLNQEKQTIEHDRRNTTTEIERLKASNTTLEQLLKSKEYVIVSLNRENQMLSAVNHGGSLKKSIAGQSQRNGIVKAEYGAFISE
jgi:chromosome segregation ATPase